MIMKRIYMLSILAVLSVGCGEDYLERPPLDQVSDFSFWKTDNDLKMYVNSFYRVFPSYKGRGMGQFQADYQSDNMAVDNPNKRLAGQLNVPTSAGSSNYDVLWYNAFDITYNFDWIRGVNIMINNYQRVTSPWEKVRQYVGEAYFFRAYLYFDLLKNYGDLPWVNKPLAPGDKELYSSRISRSVVADSIIADLDKASAYMLSKGGVSNSRLNSEIALLFKSRVSLFEGTWEKYHAGTPFGVNGSDGTRFLTVAATSAKELIDRGLYSINNTGNPYTDYQVCFNQSDFSKNPEIMLWKAYSEDLGLVNYSQMGLLGNYDWIGYGGITKSMVDSYLCTDGLPISKSALYAGDATLADEFKNRDPRMNQTIFKPGDPVRIEPGDDTTRLFTKPTFDEFNNSRTGYRIRKGLDPHNLLPEDEAGETAQVIFRYAEALMNFAEAKAELGTLSQSDVDISVNVLRDRVTMPHLDISSIAPDPNWAFPTLSPLINEIRRERRVEFGCEGMRFDDLLRWKADELIVGKRPRGVRFIQSDYPDLVVGEDINVDDDGYVDLYQKILPSGYQFNPGRDYLLPIAVNELTLNTNLTQNPGW
jgi:hypothetical protein